MMFSITNYSFSKAYLLLNKWTLTLHGTFSQCYLPSQNQPRKDLNLASHQGEKKSLFYETVSLRLALPQTLEL